MKIINVRVFATTMLLYLISCNSQPRVIEAETLKAEIGPTSIPVLNELPKVPVNDSETTLRTVVVKEVLTTEKYAYMRVKENEATFWIAITKQEVSVGDTFLFKGGLLKRNFYSREFDRVFETVYLVSNIRKQGIPERENTASAKMPTKIKTGEVLPDLAIGQIELAEGAIALQELMTNKAAFAGKRVKVTGKCVKVNPMIMNRNWLHVQDGSGDNLDLTVTTLEKVPLGAIVTLEGVITLDKDFGAGYRYDIIMEEATVK